MGDDSISSQIKPTSETLSQEPAEVSIDPRQFRDVLGHLPTGVTVITAYGDAGLMGMAANSVTSVSLAPPLVLFCPARTSSTWSAIRAGGAFCINVLAGHHAHLSRQFSATGGERFAGVAHHRHPSGPALDEAVAWIDCEIDTEHDAGDHTIVVARVIAVEAATDLGPLVFFQGRYWTLSD